VARSISRRKKTLAKKYPPSQPCTCDTCIGYCIRPGWWTVEEAERVIDAGLTHRIMLEMDPEGMFGVLSPAFKGCEADLALNAYASAGCTFFKNQRCELHCSGLMPLECCFCHHDRPGEGQQCHSDIEQDWNSHAGRTLVMRWSKRVGLWKRLNSFRLHWH
jgi:hypothetical protein